MLNELRREAYKRFVQTLIYIPHFISWVVVVGIAYIMFTPDGGIVTGLIARLGGPNINFLLSNAWFRPLIIGEVIWKETGWGTILFLAALSSVDPQLYEAARMDGAGRWRQLWHVTLPAIKSTVIILLILRLGTFLDSGFEQIILMLNPMNQDVGNVFDTFVYTDGIQQGHFSYATAANLFKSVVGIVLVLSANYLAKKAGEEGVY
jgi:putative aldouronate transport system permease protein